MADFTYNKLDPGPPSAYHDTAPKSDPPLDMEKAYRSHLARQKWGPDMPWYLPESLVGDVPYRYQGVALHTLMAALTAPLSPPVAAGNLGYVGYSLATGRTQRPKIGEGGIPLVDTEVPGARNGKLPERQWEGERATREAWRTNHALENRLGLVTNWSGPMSLFGPHPEPDDAKRGRAVHEYLTAGGVGAQPY